MKLTLKSLCGAALSTPQPLVLVQLMELGIQNVRVYYYNTQKYKHSEVCNVAGERSLRQDT
jgi:hypothetical protein